MMTDEERMNEIDKLVQIHITKEINPKDDELLDKIRKAMHDPENANKTVSQICEMHNTTHEWAMSHYNKKLARRPVSYSTNLEHAIHMVYDHMDVSEIIIHKHYCVTIVCMDGLKYQFSGYKTAAANLCGAALTQAGKMPPVF